jgi:hypothetical protein
MTAQIDQKKEEFVIPKRNYELTFSNGKTLIICDKTFRQILGQYEEHQDIMLFTKEFSMINLNHIVSIRPLE